ncbi:MAG: HNH endonuclease [Candidatus Eisenbacteria bacterium]|nr:HNH endonuclease [Candidatus Eisenbacteria bacterium]
MTDYLLNSVPDSIVLRDLASHDHRQKDADALLIAHIAVVDERRLYLGLGYSSMLEYCVAQLNHTEDSALKRIRVGRAARRHPALFVAIAEGRLHLSGALLLAPHLTPDNALDLIAAASRQSKLAIERLLAERFPRPDFATCIAPELSGNKVAPGPPVPSESQAPGVSTGPLSSHSRATPLSPGRVGWQTTVDDETQELLDEFQSLISHSAPTAGMAELLKRALTIAVTHEKKRRFAVGAKGRSRVVAAKGRDIPDSLLREVYVRDGGCCTFTGPNGHRCGSRRKLEVDHKTPVALGGATTLDNLRLLCRAHNRFEAERVFGKEHMQRAVELAQRERAKEQVAAQAGAERAAERAAERETAPSGPRDEALQQLHDDVVAALRALGYNEQQSLGGAKVADENPKATLEECVKLALGPLSRKVRHRGAMRAKSST